MRAKTNRLPILALTLLGAAAGLILRRWQLQSAFDEAGLILSGSAATWVLGIFCVLITAVLALTAAQLFRRGTYMESFSSGQMEMVISVCAAALILAGCAMALLAQPSGGNLMLNFLGILSALCIGATAMQRYHGTVPSIALHLVPCLYLVIKLIVDFKQWSVDPAVLDYCYHLFAAISTMCAVFHLGGFCFGRGRRRITTFWCLTSLVFSAIALADGGLSRCLLLGGMGLWTGINGWQLLED